MEQTLLESILERHLVTLDMRLGDRVYAEDCELAADLQDLTNPLRYPKIKSTKEEAIFIAVEEMGKIESGETISEQFLRGDYPTFERRSAIAKGLGFSYCIYVSLPEGTITKEVIDEVLKKRAFGKQDYETMSIWYNSEAAWQGFTSARSQVQLAGKFYNFFSGNNKFGFTVNYNNKIEIGNSAKLAEYDESEQIRDILEEVESRFNGETFSRETGESLMNYLSEIKERVSFS